LAAQPAGLIYRHPLGGCERLPLVLLDEGARHGSTAPNGCPLAVFQHRLERDLPGCA
jgi:hypothetical protein